MGLVDRRFVGNISVCACDLINMGSGGGGVVVETRG